MKLWERFTELTVTKKLRMGGGAVVEVISPTTGLASTVDLTELGVLDGLLATTAELNRAADVSTRNVSLAASTAITEALHDGKNLILGGAGSARTMTLPASTGSGAIFHFIVGAVNTSNYLVKAVAGTDVFAGGVCVNCDNAADAVIGFTPAATDDTLTLNGTTTGGVQIGDWVEFRDIAANKWAVSGMLTASGSETTPFSDTVA